MRTFGAAVSKYILTSLECEGNLGFGRASSALPKDGLLSAARGILGDVFGLLLAEDGRDEPRGSELHFCVMGCRGFRREL